MPQIAIFGTVLFGETYFGELRITAPAQGPADGCGGTFGSITFGSPYFGQLIDCGSEPPVPPVPPAPRRPGGGYSDALLESARRRDDMERREDEWPKQRQKIIDREMDLHRQDEEDIAQIMALWLTLK